MLCVAGRCLVVVSGPDVQVGSGLSCYRLRDVVVGQVPRQAYLKVCCCSILIASVNPMVLFALIRFSRLVDWPGLNL